MKPILIVVLLLLSVSLHSQNTTYLGVELGLTNPRLLDVNNSLISYIPDFGHVCFGFSLRREVGHIFSIETGYLRHEYMDDFKVNNIYTSAGAFLTHQIQLLLHISKEIYDNKVSLFAMIGPQFCIEQGTGHVVVIAYDGSGKRLIVNYESNEMYFALISGEVGISYKVFDEFALTLSGGFYKGFKKIREYNVEYCDDDVLLNTLSTYSQGEYWHITLGASYPIGRVRKLIRDKYSL